jgi:hypothetical protein
MSTSDPGCDANDQWNASGFNSPNGCDFYYLVQSAYLQLVLSQFNWGPQDILTDPGSSDCCAKFIEEFMWWRGSNWQADATPGCWVGT